ncbi:unnamed protein product, partial [Candidula unifasciata]
PTAETSDFTTMSAHTYSDLQEEQLRETDLKLSQLDSVRTVRKSLIPVRSASHSRYMRSLTDSFVRPRGHECDVTERISSATSDVANISTLPTDSRGSGNIKSCLPKATANLHSRVKNKHAALTGQEGRLEKTETLWNALKASRAKMPASTGMFEAHRKNHGTPGTDNLLGSWCKLSSGDSAAEAAKGNFQNAGCSKVEAENTFQAPSDENDWPLQCFYATNKDQNINPSSQWQSTMKCSDGCPSPAPLFNKRKSFTTGFLSRKKPAVEPSTNLKALNIFSSVKPKEFNTKKETQDNEILSVRQRRSLGPRSKSCIPVRKMTPSNEKTPQHSFNQCHGVLKSGTSSGTVVHEGPSTERKSVGKKVIVSQLENPRDTTVEIAIQSKAQEVKTNKPPLPKQRFRSLMSNIKTTISKSSPSRDISVKAPPSARRMQTVSPSSSVSPSQKAPYSKQFPCTIKQPVNSELQTPRCRCRKSADDSGVLRLSGSRFSQESTRLNKSKSTLVASNHNQRQSNQQVNEKNITGKQPVPQAEPELKPHKTNRARNKTMSRPQLQPAGSPDKQPGFIQQRQDKTTQINPGILKQTPKWPQHQQKQSKQYDAGVSPIRQQTKNASGDKKTTPNSDPSHGKNFATHGKKNKRLMSAVEKTTSKKNELNSDMKTESQKLESKSTQDSRPGNKDLFAKSEVVKAAHSHENEKSPVHMSLATSHGPSENSKTSCSRERNLKRSKRSKCGHRCLKGTSNQASLDPGQQCACGCLVAKNSGGQGDNSTQVGSMDTLNTDSNSSNTDGECDKMCPCASPSLGRSQAIQQDPKSSKKVNERESKHRSVVWNKSESEVVIQTSKRKRDKEKPHVLADSKIKVKTDNSLRHSAVGGPEDAHGIPKKPNKHIFSPRKFETAGHVDCDPLSTRMATSHQSGQPQEDRSKQQTSPHRDWSAINSDLDKQPGSPSWDYQPSEVVDQDDDDKKIQADLEETLIKLYQVQNSLHLRVITLQDSIRQLGAGLSLLQQPHKADPERDFQWEGTVYDYLMLLGFMVLQFCIQYVVMIR